MALQHGREKLSKGSSEEFFEFEYDEEEKIDDVETKSLENQNGIR